MNSYHEYTLNYESMKMSLSDGLKFKMNQMLAFDFIIIKRLETKMK